jgi:hypothetical protein
MKRKAIMAGALLLALLAAAAAFALFSRAKSGQGSISNFYECASAGHPVQESYPRVCQVPNGQAFTEPENSGASTAIPADQALDLIKSCKAVGTYKLHDGTVGLILKNDAYQPVTGVSEEYLQANQNQACPFSRAAIE